MTDSLAAASAAAHSTAGDVRRQGGWLPDNQDDLEAWLLQLINPVLTMAPEYNEDAMVVLPLGAILD